MNELSKYIINYYSNLMTREESQAHRHILRLNKIANASSEKMKLKLRSDLCTDDPNVLSLLNEGEERFYLKVSERIINENRDKIFLNYCPKCGLLTRTPKAKQCNNCGYEWH